MAYCLIYEFHIPLSDILKMTLREKIFYYACLLVKADNRKGAENECR